MDLSLIIARLKAQLPGLKSISGSADMAAAMASVIALPAAFVLPLADKVDNIDMTGGTEEQSIDAFGVIHVLSNVRDPRGDASLDDLKTFRANLRTALVGWVPDATNGEPVHRTGGHLLSLDDKSRLWWIDEFQLTSYYRSA